MNETKLLADRVNQYVQELDHLVSVMQSSGFPFDDAEMIYSEVSSRLKEILAETV